MHNRYELDTIVLRTADPFELMRSEKASVDASGTMLAVPIKSTAQRVGYVFLGPGKLLVDAIIETEHGALGKSIQRELGTLFLMIGNTENVSKHFGQAKPEDFKNAKIDERTFLEKAQGLIDRFSNGHSVHGHRLDDSTVIFAFDDFDGKLSILLLKDSELIYTTKDLSFVWSENKSVLHSSRQVVVSENGRSTIVGIPHTSIRCH